MKFNKCMKFEVRDTKTGARQIGYEELKDLRIKDLNDLINEGFEVEVKDYYIEEEKENIIIEKGNVEKFDEWETNKRKIDECAEVYLLRVARALKEIDEKEIKYGDDLELLIKIDKLINDKKYEKEFREKL